MSILYTAHATTTGGRSGHTETDDKALSFDLSVPGSGKPGTNPEQLFACGYSACFGSAIDAVAKMSKTAIGAISVTADIDLNKGDDGYSISATLNVTIGDVDDATGKKLVEDAHQICPYSKATRGNVDVKLNYNSQPLSKAA